MYVNPYQQFQPMQQAYPQFQQGYEPRSTIVGKMVQTPNDIMPGDIPMNGTPCFFPMHDGSAVFMKVWNPDGTIGTVKFLPEASAPKEPTQLDRIEAMLSRLSDGKGAVDE